MRKYTQSDLDTIIKNEKNEFGYYDIPSGDWTDIKEFPNWCRFGEGCSFGLRCKFGEECNFGEGCSFGEQCSFGKWCRFGEECNFGEGCSFGEWGSFGKKCIATSPFWSFQYEPPFVTKGKIYPTVSSRDYWSERLGIDLTDKCYKNIAELIVPKIPELLKLDKWTKCERRILESWNNA